MSLEVFQSVICLKIKTILKGFFLYPLQALNQTSKLIMKGIYSTYFLSISEEIKAVTLVTTLEFLINVLSLVNILGGNFS